MPAKIVPKKTTTARIVPKRTKSEAEIASSVEHPKLVEAGLLEEPETSDYFRHYIGKRVPGLLSAAGGTLGGLGAGSSSFGLGTMAGAGAGALVGSGIGTGLQGMFPRLFGEKPEDVVSKVLTDAAIEGAVPEGIGKAASVTIRPITKVLNRVFPAIREGIAKQEAKQLEKKILPESQIIETAAENTRLNPNIPSPGTIGLGNTVADDLIKVPYQQTNLSSQQIKEITKKALSDVSEVRNFKLATGGDHEIRQLAFNDILTRNYSGATKTFNPTKILDELNGSKREIYQEAIGKKGLEQFKTFLLEMQKPSTTQHPVLSYIRNRLAFSVPMFMVGGGLGGLAGGAAASGASIILNDAVLTKIMSYPEVAGVMTRALKTGLKDTEAEFLQRVIANSMRGTKEAVGLLLPDGEIQKAYVTDDGKLTYEKPKER